MIDQALKRLDALLDTGVEQRLGETLPAPDGLGHHAAPEAQLVADAVRLPAVHQDPLEPAVLAHPLHRWVRLADQPRHALVVSLAQEHLQRDCTPQAWIPGFVDDPHRSGSEAFTELVGADREDRRRLAEEPGADLGERCGITDR